MNPARIPILSALVILLGLGGLVAAQQNGEPAAVPGGTPAAAALGEPGAPAAAAPGGRTGASPSGALVLRFIYKGKRPEPLPLAVTKDQAAFGATVADQSLVVGEDGGLANVLVYLASKDIHPDVVKATSKEAVLRVEGGLLQPRVLPLVLGQPLRLSNPSPVAINLYFPTMSNPQLNVLIPPQADPVHRFEREQEKLPVPVTCTVHPWMRAYLMPLAHPYADVSGRDGTARIPDLPVGQLPFRLWHERVGFLKPAGSTDRQFTFDIQPGGNRLDIQVDQSLSVTRVRQASAVDDPPAVAWVFDDPRRIEEIVRGEDVVEIDTITDSISTQNDIRLRSKFGEATIRPGELKLLNLGEDVHETFYSWGDEARDRIGGYGEPFRWLKFDWQRDGKLRLTFYKVNPFRERVWSSDPEARVQAMSGQCAELEQEAIRLADEWRKLDLPELDLEAAEHQRELKSRLRETVAAAFEARQSLQRAELAQLAERLARIQQTVAGREQLKTSIIDRRVAELLDPKLQWDPAPPAPNAAKANAAGTPKEPAETASRREPLVPDPDATSSQAAESEPDASHVSQREGTLTATAAAESRIPLKARLLFIQRDWSVTANHQAHDEIRQVLARASDAKDSEDLAADRPIGPGLVFPEAGRCSIFTREDFASLEAWLGKSGWLLAELPVEQTPDKNRSQQRWSTWMEMPKAGAPGLAHGNWWLTAEVRPALTRPDDEGVWRIVDHPDYLAHIELSRSWQVMQARPGGPRLRGASISIRPKVTFHLPPQSGRGDPLVCAPGRRIAGRAGRNGIAGLDGIRGRRARAIVPHRAHLSSPPALRRSPLRHQPQTTLAPPAPIAGREQLKTSGKQRGRSSNGTHGTAHLAPGARHG
ncbi:MAG: hypothetical protein WD847_04420 [Pirellulales bacterium]